MFLAAILTVSVFMQGCSIKQLNEKMIIQGMGIVKAEIHIKPKPEKGEQ